MSYNKGNLSAAVGAFAVAAGLLFGAAVSANAQGRYDPYYGQGTYSGRDYGRHQKDEKKAEKRHQKQEKEALKRHQKEERDYYGNDAELREHQRQEREEMKQHERYEKEQRKDHQRDERYGRNDGYYGDDGYGGYSNNRQAVFDGGYRDGVRAGRDDRARNRQYDYERHSAYRNASGGYSGQYGDAEVYRDGFRRGYDEGYRSGRSTRWGDILGGIFGRP